MAVFLLAVFVLIVLALYWYFHRDFNYWSKRNIPYLKPLPILGNYKYYILMKTAIGEVAKNLCQKMPKEPYIGTFYGTKPALLVQSPDIIKLITTKDFYYFNSREVSMYTHKEVTTQNIFFTYGDRWKVLRQNFTPLFSSAKMKEMFHLVENCAYLFEEFLNDATEVADVTDVRSLMARFTMECIGSCIFGVETNSLGKDENNIFRRIGVLMFEISNRRGLKQIGRSIWPEIFYGLRLKIFPKVLDDFFHKLITGMFKARNYTSSPRNDFIDLMLTLKKEEYITGASIDNVRTGENRRVSFEVTDELLVGQCSILFAAGFETTATTLSYTLHELAKNQYAQTRAAAEIDQYLENDGGKLRYSCVNAMPWLKACVDEALRLYPVLGMLTRELLHDYELPDGSKLKPGLRIHIPVYHLHTHPDYFPDPLEYKPERFMPENRSNILPYTYMPFGEGPRACIGVRFARMMMTTGLVTLLKKYRVELSAKTPRVLKVEPRALVTQPSTGVQLKLTPREGWEGRAFQRKL